jgi:hypothetical protein
MQHVIMECAEVAARLGIKPGSVCSGVLCGRTTIPRPDGQVGRIRYWLREDVDEWLVLQESRRSERPEWCRASSSFASQPPGSLSERDLISLEKLADLSPGEQARIVMGTASWRDVLSPLLAVLDAERPKKGPKPAYSSEELERCLMFQCLAEKSTYAEARALLVDEHGEHDRAQLGFDSARASVGRNLLLVGSDCGVPSEATVWRHKNRFGVERHARAYDELFERLADEPF